MPINISDVVIQIGQQNPSLLKDIFVPFVSVIAGAYIGHKLNLKQEEVKLRNDVIKNFIVLTNEADFLFNELMSYKNFIETKVKPTFVENVIQGATIAVYTQQIDFKAKFNDYAFLTNYNSQFLYLISQVNKTVELLFSSVETYKNRNMWNRETYCGNNLYRNKG